MDINNWVDRVDWGTEPYLGKWDINDDTMTTYYCNHCPASFNISYMGGRVVQKLYDHYETEHIDVIILKLLAN